MGAGTGLRVGLFVVVGVVIAGCRASASSEAEYAPVRVRYGDKDQRVTFVGSQTYQTTTSQFRYSADEAAKIAMEFHGLEAQWLDSVMESHLVLVDNDYVFLSNPHKLGISISGVYVNGHTGVAREARTFGYIRMSENPDWVPHVRSLQERRPRAGR